SQVRALTAHLPEYTGKIIDIARVIDERYPGLNLSLAVEEFLHNLTSNLQSYLTDLIKNIFDLVSFLMNVIFIGFVLTPFILYYFMVDAVKIRRALLRLFPPEERKEYVFLLRKIDAVVGGFIRARLSACLFVGVCVGVGLFFMGVEFPLVIGVIAGIADIIPYLGPIIGAVPALAFAASKSVLLVLGVIALFVGVNLVEEVIILPKFLGRETGLHPITVLFALIVGGKLYGALGVIIAIPVAGVLKELFGYYRRKGFSLTG
ncbi:MAG: AI-2E family transporter, partial [Candidatus Atribacteria bacterium]|nr:AI-2E family transporter [Candidatus Atribacteria bacterium]MCD6350394.1 AI-2E family transporter [Candidatus Atribacteria bacterium]